MKPLMLAIAAAVALSGCALVKVEDGKDWDMVVVPAGHMPPSGQCRIWYPDRPLAQQPSPGDCTELRDKVPEGAYLVRT